MRSPEEEASPVVLERRVVVACQVVVGAVWQEAVALSLEAGCQTLDPRWVGIDLYRGVGAGLEIFSEAHNCRVYSLWIYSVYSSYRLCTVPGTSTSR